MEFIKENKIKSQSKLDSSFLEELSIYLFENLDLIHKNSFTVFNKKIFAGLKISNDNSFDVLTKDVDFCIGRKINLQLSTKSKEIIFPLISVEVKTYVDATMLGEIMSSSKKIKSSTPFSKCFVLCGYVDFAEYHFSTVEQDSSIDQIYVLRKNSTDTFDYRAFAEYYEDVYNFIYLFFQHNKKIKKTGRMLHK
ncbi:Bpu10I family restriction endonuclease [Mycoplasma sp. 1458C]